MPWRRVIAVWGLIVVAECLQGVARQLFIAPALGDLPARQLGVVTGSVMILLIAWLTRSWLALPTTYAQLAVGVTWAGLMVAFELGLGRALGSSWARLLADYDLSRGGWMGLGIVCLSGAPWLVGRLRAREDG